MFSAIASMLRGSLAYAFYADTYNVDQSHATEKNTPFPLVATCAGWNSRLAARRITQFFDREVSDCGLTTAQLGLVAQIGSAADDTLGTLARRSGIEQSTLSRNLWLAARRGADRDHHGQARCAAPRDLADRGRCATAGDGDPVWRKAHAKLARRVLPGLASRLADETEALIRD
jgi:hypothetical protein